jgi:hypothetical protein
MKSDDYETKYMGGGQALARSRAGMPWWFHLLLAFACVAVVAPAVAHGTLASLVTLPFLLFVWVLFMFLRVTVTAETVHVQLGVFGPKIPVANIVEVAVERYPVLKYGGWGIRFALDGSVAYSVPGHGGRGVRIRYKKKNGRESTVWVTSPDPDALVAAIEQARAGSGVRVAENVRVGAEEVPLPTDVDAENEEHNQARG